MNSEEKFHVLTAYDVEHKGYTLEHAIQHAKDLACKKDVKMMVVKIECIGEATPIKKATYQDIELKPLSDREYDLFPLPEGIAPPPEGFAYYGLGPMKKPAEEITENVALYVFVWEKNKKGLYNGHYALRIGSDIAKANGIGGGE